MTNLHDPVKALTFRFFVNWRRFRHEQLALCGTSTLTILPAAYKRHIDERISGWTDAMSPTEILVYFGSSFVYACLLTVLVFGLMHLVSQRQDGSWRSQSHHARIVGFVIFFLILTQYPFPSFSALDCSQGGARPILQPFAILSRFSQLAQHADGLRPWLSDKVVQSSGMNFLLCCIIGLALSRYLQSRWRLLKAFSIGALLSLTAEVLQLTGILGLYPCPYRQFEVDDLILNISGVVSGVALAEWFGKIWKSNNMR